MRVEFQDLRISSPTKKDCMASIRFALIVFQHDVKKKLLNPPIPAPLLALSSEIALQISSSLGNLVRFWFICELTNFGMN